MENKKKALEQLSDIHSSMIDSENKTPIDPNIALLWAIASAIMFLGFEIVLGFGIHYAIFFIIGVSIFAYGVEFFMIRNENDKYDIAKMTHNQNIIQWNYNISIIFAIILTLVFNNNAIGNYSYSSWVFLIAFANLNTGLILNKSSFKLAGILGLVVSVVMFGILLYFGTYYLSIYDKYISVLVCSGSLLYISIMLKK